ncbi:MAG: DNA polymerase III subunit gamma/tau [Rhodanobacteraceae bacterium]
MSYQVLARKWRPKQFAELVGQEHVVRALSNALDADRTHHAYLFAGTRGIGKTTIARIFAKSINCEHGQSAEPCGECAVCTAVDAGRFVDLLEIDAASNTGVDDVRELIENAQYAPSRGRYKVYLIDEVHMLSRSAFNALLKTLEEPPEHVKFLLATTDPDKLPMTVLSRCLKFNLKRLLPQQIGDQLRHILEAEKIDFDTAAVDALALAADGSMRDGLSLLDQSLAYGGNELRDEPTRAMLGTVEHGSVLALLEALAAGDGSALLQQAETIAEHAPDFAGVLDQLAGALHQIQLHQLVPGHRSVAGPNETAFQNLASSLSAEEVQLYYQLAGRGRRELGFAPDAQTGFEMVLLRMLAFRPGSRSDPPPQGPKRRTGAVPGERQPSSAPDKEQRVAEAAPSAGPASERVSDSREAEAPVVPQAPASDQGSRLFGEKSRCAGDWHTWIAQSGLTGPTGELARNAILQDIDGAVWTLQLRPELMSIAVEPMTSRLREALGAYVGQAVKLRFVSSDTVSDTPAERRQQADQARQSEAERAIRDDPMVQGLESELGARVVPQSIQAL